MKGLNTGKITILMVLVTMLITGGTGCYQVGEEESVTQDDRPFYSDRVVTVRVVMSEEDWEFSQTNALSEQYVKADLWYDGELVPDIAIRPKGNSSLRTAVRSGTPRFSLKADLNFFNSARNLYGVKKLNFNNGFSDPTLIRETLSYELFELMNIPAPRTSFVDLWVNDTHLGLYTMVEQVDKTFLSQYFVDNTGNLYKPEMPAAYLSWTEEDLEKQQERDGVTSSQDQMDEMDINLGGGKLLDIMQALEPKNVGSQVDTSVSPPDILQDIIPPRVVVPPEGNIQQRMPANKRGNLIEQMGLKTNENKADHSLLFRFLDILNSEPDETFPAEIEKVLDVDEVLRFLAVSTLIVHLDNYIALGHNYYLYEDNGKLVVIPWDLNMAFGTFNFGLDRKQLINYYIDEPTGGPVAERPLVDRLLSHQPYLDAYHGYLKELLDGPFAVDRMSSRIDELATLIRPYVRNDELKFFSTRQFEIGLEGEIIRQGGEGPRPLGLKDFIVERSKSVREQLAGKRISSSGDGSGNGGSFGVRRDLPRLPQ